MRKAIAYLFRQACRVVCMLGLVCGLASCSWHEAKEVIALADSLDQNEHVIYDDTTALGRAIRSLDNPFGRVLMSNTLGKAYYYMGRNLSFANEIADAAECYIEADRLQIDDPIYRGRVNVCIGNICAQNSCDSLALIFYERASEIFQESGNDWYYAHTLLDKSESRIYIRDYAVADTLLQIAQSYKLDSAYRARYLETHGLYFYAQQQYDSALIYFNQGLNYWQFESEKCFSYLKILQVYYDLNQLHLAIPYAKFIVEHSTSPNYIANAYYCLMQDAKNQNNVELLSQYSHARTDAQQELRRYMLQDAEAVPLLEEYSHNPRPWRWVWMVMCAFASLCVALVVGIVLYRRFATAQIHASKEQIVSLSVQVTEQAGEIHKHAMLHYYDERLDKIRRKYPKPLSSWNKYDQLKKDINPYLKNWIIALEKLNLTKRENVFCVLSFIYPQMAMENLASSMCITKSAFMVRKTRIAQNLGIPSAQLGDFLYNLSPID